MAGQETRYAIGIRVTTDRLHGVMVDLDGTIVPMGSESGEPNVNRTLYDSSPAAIVAGIAALREDLLSLRPDLRPHVVGLGAAVGGHVDGESGEVRLSPQLGWTATVPLRRQLMDATGLRAVSVENDVKALAVSEQLFGQGQMYRSFALVTVGVGIGCALVLDHELYTGASGLAGEFGHLAMEPDGRPCRCGNRGCLETIAGCDAILRFVRDSWQSDPATIDELAALARVGDNSAQAAIERAGEMLGRALSMLLNLLNLEIVLLRVEESLLATDTYIRNVRTALDKHAFSTASTDCRILPAPLTPNLEARGAASMAFRDLADQRY
jgi:predicted NBD/HSP70 family sugar kinase